MDKNRIIKLIKILSKVDSPVTGKELSKYLDVTVRTLRSDIKANKQDLHDNGIDISSKHAVGYELKIINEKKYYKYLENIMKEESDNQMLIPIYPEERINYMIRMLLTSGDYIKIEDMCSKIFVSRSTISNDLKEVRERLKYFHLDLETKPSYGIKIEGSEFHKRSCISKYFFHTNGGDDMYLSKSSSSAKHKVISELLYRTMLEECFKLTDLGFQNLVIHIIIALQRINDAQNQVVVDYDSQIEATNEYQIAKKLIGYLEDEFNVVFPNIEVYYISLHLSGKKAAQYSSNILYMNSEYEELLTSILSNINTRFDMDFSSDIDLQMALSLHLQPMMNRLKYGMPIQNPLLDHIKYKNPVAFEISIMAAKIIRDLYGVEVSENEIGYIALHFALAVERYKKNGPKKNIIIICASGMGSSQILLYKIKQKFRENINSIYVTELYELPKLDQSLYDFILSTVPIPFPTDIPVVNVQYFLDDMDMISLSDAFKNQNESMSFVDKYFSDELFFSDLSGKTKEELIHEMCTNIGLVKELPINFEKEVLNRENFSVTEFGNMIAMPHPMKPMTEETFVAVGVLKKPVLWHRKKVKYIFLLSIENNASDTLGLLHETLSTLVSDSDALMLFENDMTLRTLKSILKNIADSQKENVIDVIFG